MKLEVWTDGACIPNPGEGSWGFVIVNTETKVKIYEESGWKKMTTSNHMEYLALVKAFEYIKKTYIENPIEIKCYSDSMLLVNTFNLWMEKWNKTNWQTKKKKEIKNLELVKELYLFKKIYPLSKMFWVKGHSGIFWNEYCDEMCLKELKNLDNP